MAENFPKFKTDTKPQIQEGQKYQAENTKTNQNIMPRYIIFKLLKINYKKEILKALRENKGR